MNNPKKIKESFSISTEVSENLTKKAGALNLAKSQLVEHSLRLFLNLSLDYSPNILAKQAREK